MFRIRTVACFFLIAVLLVSPVCGAEAEVIHYPISGNTIIISPGDPNLVSDEMCPPIIEITEFQLTPGYIAAELVRVFDIHYLSPLQADLLAIVAQAITAILTIITSRYIIVLLYTRRKLSNDPKSRPMKILGYLIEHPGAQQIDIIQATGYSRGSVSYNLKKLQAEQRIYRTEEDTTRYYAAGSNPAKNSIERLLENSNRRNIFQTIFQNPGISQREISRKTKIPMSTLRWHLKKLRRENCIIEATNSRNTTYTINPEVETEC